MPLAAIVAFVRPGLRPLIQPALPAPVDLANDVDGQTFNHGDPLLRREHQQSLCHRPPVMPMIYPTWTLSVAIASFFGRFAGME
jgi:hypothetical protein